MTPKPITIQGTTFPSIKSALLHFQIRYQTVIRRLNRGMSFDDAYSIPTNEQRRRKEFCKRNHKLEGNNLIIRKDKKGYLLRTCRECKNLSERTKRQKRKPQIIPQTTTKRST